MKLTTLIFPLGVVYGLVSARFSLQGRNNNLPHGGYPITPRHEVPQGGYPVFPVTTRTHRRAGNGTSLVPAGTNSTSDVTTSNWGGLVIKNPPANEHFVSASAQIQVPDVKLPADAPDGKYATSIWVGIDGTNGTNPGLFQAGLVFNLIKDTNGTRVESGAWAEWIPDIYIGIDDKKEFDMKPGDWIDVQVVTDSSIERPTTGTITITNLNTEKKAVRTLRAPGPGFAMMGTSVEWIVERLLLHGQLSTLPDFGTIHFDNCHALTKGNAGSGSPGRDVNLDGATQYIISQDGKLMTNVVPGRDGIEFDVEYKPRH